MEPKAPARMVLSGALLRLACSSGLLMLVISDTPTLEPRAAAKESAAFRFTVSLGALIRLRAATECSMYSSRIVVGLALNTFLAGFGAVGEQLSIEGTGAYCMRRIPTKGTCVWAHAWQGVLMLTTSM
ncbi:hypothetical protein P154DRAFT_575728 [Amniculicola lignicola CBS 123094]|uniref:Secreted protein n=1 Tax=Amniculicola lignicola CBS 123094 TaxID=1392246 RepID=A0A6A5WKJ7_9PLEO|nr:hypothetical protein P154DRAFT_575728 [Amniculicola lignicola CBS 123094]